MNDDRKIVAQKPSFSSSCSSTESLKMNAPTQSLHAWWCIPQLSSFSLHFFCLFLLVCRLQHIMICVIRLYVSYAGGNKVNDEEESQQKKPWAKESQDHPTLLSPDWLNPSLLPFLHTHSTAFYGPSLYILKLVGVSTRERRDVKQDHPSSSFLCVQ